MLLRLLGLSKLAGPAWPAMIATREHDPYGCRNCLIAAAANRVQQYPSPRPSSLSSLPAFPLSYSLSLSLSLSLYLSLSFLLFHSLSLFLSLSDSLCFSLSATLSLPPALIDGLHSFHSLLAVCQLIRTALSLTHRLLASLTPPLTHRPLRPCRSPFFLLLFNQIQEVSPCLPSLLESTPTHINLF